MSSTTTQTTTPSTSGACSISNGAGGILHSLAPIVLMILAFYFLIIKPQQKREAKRVSLINSVKKGDKVITNSGIIGEIHKVISEKEVSIEVSEGVRMTFLKSAIADVVKNDVALKQSSNNNKED